MSFPHAAVWIDHQGAHVILFNHDDSRHVQVHAHGGEGHLHHKRGSIGDGRAPLDRHYFDEVAAAVAGIGEVLVTGPASAKDEFIAHLEKHHPQIRKCVAGVAPADHQTPAQVLAHGRKWFASADRLRPGSGMHMPE